MRLKWLGIPLLFMTIGCTHSNVSEPVSGTEKWNEPLSVHQFVYPDSVRKDVYTPATKAPLEHYGREGDRLLPDFNP